MGDHQRDHTEGQTHQGKYGQKYHTQNDLRDHDRQGRHISHSLIQFSLPATHPQCPRSTDQHSEGTTEHRQDQAVNQRFSKISVPE